MATKNAGNRFHDNTAEGNSGWGFLADFDSPNDSLTAHNSALTNGAGAFGEIDFSTADFAAYTDIGNPWDCRNRNSSHSGRQAIPR